jgi:hypothetical protein
MTAIVDGSGARVLAELDFGEMWEAVNGCITRRMVLDQHLDAARSRGDVELVVSLTAAWDRTMRAEQKLRDAAGFGPAADLTESELRAQWGDR